MIQLTANSQRYTQLLKKLQPTIEANSVAQLNRCRTEAIERFEELGGFPTTQVEDYKYTNIDKVFDCEYATKADNCENAPLPENYETLIDDSYKIQLRNGVFVHCEVTSELEELGIIVCSLKEAAQKHTALFEKFYNKKTRQSEHSIAALNTAFVEDGLFVYIPKNVQLAKPFQIINFLSANDDLLVNTRQLLIIDKHAQVQFVEGLHTLTTSNFLTNSVVELFAEDKPIA